VASQRNQLGQQAKLQFANNALVLQEALGGSEEGPKSKGKDKDA